MEELHFLRPWWLLAFLPVAYCAVKMWNAREGRGLWQKVCDPRLLPFVLINRSGTKSRWPIWLFAWGSVMAVLSLAGPAWRKEAAAVYLKTAPLVVLMDLSTSMYAQDEQPSRFERAKLKLHDILNLRREGQIGLVVFSSLPFVVTPLTTDNEAIRVLLNPLAPNLLPITGKRVDLALEKAYALLRNAGAKEGEVLLIGDDAEPAALIAAVKLRRAGYSVSVLALGSEEGAPVIVEGRPALHQGQPVLARANLKLLADVARQGGGLFQRATSDDQDMQRLLSLSSEGLTRTRVVEGVTALRWRDEGRWLLLGLLPLAALAFRRGWLAGVCLFVLPGMQPAEAFEWRSLWQNADQLGLHHYQQQNYSQALKWFADPNWQASANYQARDFKGALKGYTQDRGVSGHYNRGNSLVQLGRYKDALTEYEAALAKNPQHLHARANQELLKKFLESQKNTSNKQSGQSDPKSQDNAQKAPADKQKGQVSPSAKDDAKKAAENKPSGPSDSAPKDTTPSPGKNSKDHTEEESKQQASGLDKNDDKNSAKDEKPKVSANKSNHIDSKKISSPDTVDSESIQASEQWLQQIRDDPGRLLRQKFRLQYLREKAKYSSSRGYGNEE